MWVIKLGGSLANTPFLRTWLDTLASLKENGVVVVPGGGVFANQIRFCQQKWKFDDRTAHQMALLAMHQFGLMLASFNSAFRVAAKVKDIQPVLENNRVAVWLPEVNELDQAGIASEWQITSDSLSAWLAGQIGAQQLVIVKSDPQSGILSDPIQLTKEGILDASFQETWKKSDVGLKIFHCSNYHAFLTEFNTARLFDQTSHASDSTH